MEKRKFIQLLAILTKEEFKAFDKFVRSPYFNSNKKVMDLVQYLQKYHPNYARLSAQRLFGHLFGKKTVSERILNDLLSTAKILLERFLTQQSLEQKQFLLDYNLLQKLSTKNTTYFFDKQLKKTRAKQERKITKEVLYYQENLLLDELALSHHLRQNSRAVDSQLRQQIDQHLTIIFLASKLRYYCALQNRRSTTAQDHWQMSWMPTIFEYLKTHPMNEVPLIKAWHLLALLLTHPMEEVYFFELKTYLEKHHSFFSKGELRQLYTSLLGYCTKQAQSGKKGYWLEFLNCYELMLAENILLVDGYIQPATHFQNIVSIALRLQKYNFAKQFINNYKYLLAPQHQRSMMSFCLANVHFSQKEYAHCIAQLQNFALADHINYISHKVLLAKAYYESEQYEVLFNLLNAFSTFLHKKRKKMPNNIILTYKNFVILTKKLIKFQGNKIVLTKAEKIEKQKNINQLIQQTNPLSQRAWLLAIVEKTG